MVLSMDKLEETLMAFLLFAMTALTFANVVARYAFNSNIFWALEATVFLFAWLVLFGTCYGFKKNIHIGVDILLQYSSPRWQYILTIFASLVCITFALLMTVGAWNYWFPFISERAWLEVNDVPMPYILRFFEPLLNEGEAYEKMPRFIPYAALPLSMALLLYRSCYAFWEIINKRRTKLIASHEVEDAIAELTKDQQQNTTKTI